MVVAMALPSLVAGAQAGMAMAAATAALSKAGWSDSMTWALATAPAFGDGELDKDLAFHAIRAGGFGIRSPVQRNEVHDGGSAARKFCGDHL